MADLTKGGRYVDWLSIGANLKLLFEGVKEGYGDIVVVIDEKEESRAWMGTWSGVSVRGRLTNLVAT